jgi:hypothetical protein
MNQALGLNNGLKVNSANLQTTFARRRRGLYVWFHLIKFLFILIL